MVSCGPRVAKEHNNTRQRHVLGLAGVHVVRCAESNLKVEDDGVNKSLVELVEEKPGTDLWGSLPCRPWTLWQNMNLHLHGESFAAKLEEDRHRSRLTVRKFCKLARYCAKWRSSQF